MSRSSNFSHSRSRSRSKSSIHLLLSYNNQQLSIERNYNQLTSINDKNKHYFHDKRHNHYQSSNHSNSNSKNDSHNMDDDRFNHAFNLYSDQELELKYRWEKIVHVSNIPFHMKWGALKVLFLTKVLYIEISEQYGKSFSCGFTEFRTIEQAKHAVEKMHQFEYDGRKLIVILDDKGYQTRRAKYQTFEGRLLQKNNMLDYHCNLSNQFDYTSQNTNRISYSSQTIDFNCIGDTLLSDYSSLTDIPLHVLQRLDIEGFFTNKIFIDNLDFKCNEEKIHEIFSLAGWICTVTLKQAKKGQRDSMAVIEYEYSSEAVQAILMFNQQQLYDKIMTVKIVLKDEEKDNEKLTKLPSELHKKIYCLEDLSNELLFEIFDYLDGCAIFEAFSNLNDRFEQLLYSSSVLYRIHIFLSENDEIMNKFKRFLLLNQHKIYSLYLNLILENNYFFSSFLSNSSFYQLEYICLKVIQSNILIPILSNLSHIPRLFSLTIETLIINEKINDIYRLVFVLRQLKYYRIFSFNNDHSIKIPLAINPISPIKYLVIDHHCSFNELQSLISYTPQLHRLTVSKLDVNYSDLMVLSPITLINLNSIYLHMYQVTFNQLELFSINIHTNLKILSINSSNDITYLDAHRWEQFILHYYPQLEKFYFTYHGRIDNDNQYEIYSGRINQFSSSFWIERKWIFNVKIGTRNIEYIIYPYKKPWYHYIDDKNIQYSTANSLTLEIDLNPFYFERLFEKIKRVLTITQIYHLEILEESILFNMLIELVNQLLNLITLKLHSLTLGYQMDLMYQKCYHICSEKNQIHINKVYLQVLNNMEDLDCIMRLCPLTMYLKVGCINMNVELFVRNILKKINDECNDHLRLLCWHIPAADDQMINDLKKLMQHEQLLDHFLIKREFDNIFLQLY